MAVKKISTQVQEKEVIVAAPPKKEWLAIKIGGMKNHNRDLLVLYKSEINAESLEQTLECLHRILRSVECADVFCNAHELVKRTRITRKRLAILTASENAELKPFHFLINRN